MSCGCENKNKQTVPVVANNTKGVCKNVQASKQSCACMEDHTLKLVETSYTTTVSVTHAWVMPSVNECVQLHLKDVVNILSGALLYNNSVGLLHVKSYDLDSGYVLACNYGEVSNAEAGTTFPDCMSFQVGVPVECTCDDGYTGPCLAADYVSPAVGSCSTMSVTNVSGLFVNDIIDVAGYMYRISVIQDVNTITVCNEGTGAPIGTIIYHDPNCTGKSCIVKITVVNSDDPCTQDPINTGVLIACDSGIRKPIVGTANGQVLVWDITTKAWKLVNAGLSDTCSYTTQPVTLDPLVTAYIFYVFSSSLFSVNDQFIIDSVYYTVTQIISTTQLRATRTAPTSISIIPVGTSICKDETFEDCCDQVQINTTNISTIMEPTWVSQSAPYISDYFLNTSYDGTERSLTYANDSYSEDLTYNIAIPIDARVYSGRPNITLNGNICLSYTGTAHTDTHYYRPTGSAYPLIHISKALTMLLKATVTVNGFAIYTGLTDPVFGVGYIGHIQSYTFTPQNAGVSVTRPSKGFITQQIILPIACSVSLPVTTRGNITIRCSYIIQARNAAAIGSNVDEEIKCVISKIFKTAAFSWTLK